MTFRRKMPGSTTEREKNKTTEEEKKKCLEIPKGGGKNSGKISNEREGENNSRGRGRGGSRF